MLLPALLAIACNYLLLLVITYYYLQLPAIICNCLLLLVFTCYYLLLFVITCNCLLLFAIVCYCLQLLAIACYYLLVVTSTTSTFLIARLAKFLFFIGSKLSLLKIVYHICLCRKNKQLFQFFPDNASRV